MECLPSLKITTLLALLTMAPAAAEDSLRQYCAGRHSQRIKTAGIDLGSGLSSIPEKAEVWEKVVRRLRVGTMPPLGMPRPDRSALDRLAAYVESAIDAAAITPDPGPAVLRRLNRAEYGAAVLDLLDLDVDVAALLPADDVNHGFDNNADSLRISPALLEGYLTASRKIARLAVGDPDVTPAYSTYHVKPDLGQDSHIEGLPLGARGGLRIEHTFPLDATYGFKTRLALNTSAKVRGLDFEHRFIVTIDGVKIHEARVGGPEDEEAAAISPPESEAKILARLEVRVPVRAGPRAVGVSFIRKTAAQEDGYLQPWLRSNLDTQEQRGVPLVDSVSIGRPFEIKGPGDTPSRRKIFDLEAPLRFYRQGDRFEAGIEGSLRFILTSPEFLLRVETDPAPGSIHRVSNLELASRLSFFLWSSVPDDELIDTPSRENSRIRRRSKAESGACWLTNAHEP
jgi:hypothetical protein